MSIAAELLICVFAQFISFFYYDGKYKTKRPLRQLFAMFFAAFALQFAAGFLNVSLFGINVFFGCRVSFFKHTHTFCVL